MSRKPDFDPNTLYSIGMLYRSRTIGGAEQGSAVVVGKNANTADDTQLWYILQLNTSDAYPWIFVLKQSGYYLSTFCAENPQDQSCPTSSLIKGRLLSRADPNNLSATGRWCIEASTGDDDNSWRLWNKNSEKDLWLDLSTDQKTVIMSNNQSGLGGKWLISKVTTEPSAPSATVTLELPKNTTSNTSDSAASSDVGSNALEGSKIGCIVAGVIIAILIGGAIFGFWLLRRRKQRTDQGYEPRNEVEAPGASNAPHAVRCSPRKGVETTTPQTELHGSGSQKTDSDLSSDRHRSPAELA